MKEAIIPFGRKGAYHLGSRGYPIRAIGDVTVYDVTHNKIELQITSAKDENHEGWHNISVKNKCGSDAYVFVLNMELNLGWLRHKLPNIGDGYIKIKFEQ